MNKDSSTGYLFMGWFLCGAGFLLKRGGGRREICKKWRDAEREREREREVDQETNGGEYSDTFGSLVLFDGDFFTFSLCEFGLCARLIRSRAYDAVNVPLRTTLGVGRLGDYQHFPCPFQWDFNRVSSKEHDGSVSIQFPVEWMKNLFIF